MFCNTHQQVYLVAATGIPQEVLALHRKEHDIETQHVICGIWQAMHVYQKCWLLAEPRHNGSSTYYKCRVASSYPLLFEGEQSLDFFFTEQQLREALDAPEEPIVWDFVEDTYGNEIPVNIAPALTFYRTCIIPYPVLWKSWLAQTNECLAGEQKQSEHRQTASSPAQPVSLATYREQKAQETEPVDTLEEKVSFDSLRKAATALKTNLRPGERPERRDMPMILLHAAHSNLEQRLEHEHDSRECKTIRQSLHDVRFMLIHPRLWRWDSDNYVSIVDEDQFNGLCTISVRIHPQSRVNNGKAVRRSLSSSKQYRHNTKKRHHTRRSVS